MPADPRDYKLDLSTMPPPAASPGNPTPPAGPPRPFLSVQFACCNVYQRIYRTPDGSAYHGRCPKCGVPVTFTVGHGGTDARFFVVR